jgi:hypothetical protein
MGYLQSLANTRAIHGKRQTVVLSVATNRRYAVISMWSFGRLCSLRMTLRLNDAAVRTERRHVAWLIEEPDAFPFIEKRTQVF